MEKYISRLIGSFKVSTIFGSVVTFLTIFSIVMVQKFDLGPSRGEIDGSQEIFMTVAYYLIGLSVLIISTSIWGKKELSRYEVGDKLVFGIISVLIMFLIFLSFSIWGIYTLLEFDFLSWWNLGIPALLFTIWQFFMIYKLKSIPAV